LAACASSPTRIPTTVATPPLQASQTPQVTPTLPATEARQVPLASDWAGAILHADGTTESITVKFAEPNGTLNIEPFVQTYKLQDLQIGTMISFTTTLKSKVQFSGKFDGSQIIGQVTGNGQTDSFVLLPLLAQSKDALNDFLGTYQLDSGDTLLINLAPEYSSS